MEVVNGDILMSEALSNQKINLVDLIAEVAIWCSPEYVKKQQGAVYPDKRRGPRAKKGKITEEGIYIDDNTFANLAIKKAIGKHVRFENFFVCHIWSETAYDERYYSLLPNLVLIPKIIAGLSDHYKNVIDVLKYRSFELYGWYPQEELEPQKPVYYSANWNTKDYSIQNLDSTDESDNDIEMIEYEEYTEDREAIEVEKVKRRIPGWFDKEDQTNSRILITFMKLLQNGHAVSKDDLRMACTSIEKFEGNFNQMKNYGLKNHGKVFEEIDGGYITLWVNVSNFVRAEYKKYLERLER